MCQVVAVGQDRNAEGGMKVSKQMLLLLGEASILVHLSWWDPECNLHHISTPCKGYKAMPGLSEHLLKEKLLVRAWQGFGRVQLQVFVAARHRKPWHPPNQKCSDAMA